MLDSFRGYSFSLELCKELFKLLRGNSKLSMQSHSLNGFTIVYRFDCDLSPQIGFESADKKRKIVL